MSVEPTMSVCEAERGAGQRLHTVYLIPSDQGRVLLEARVSVIRPHLRQSYTTYRILSWTISFSRSEGMLLQRSRQLERSFP